MERVGLGSNTLEQGLPIDAFDADADGVDLKIMG